MNELYSTQVGTLHHIRYRYTQPAKQVQSRLPRRLIVHDPVESSFPSDDDDDGGGGEGGGGGGGGPR